MERDQQHADDRLIEELRGHFTRTDPVPADVLAAAHAAIEFRDLDAQIAELLSDSALEDKELAGVRGVGQRLLSFRLGERFLEVDVAAAGEHRDVSGYLVPAHAGVVKAEGPGGEVEAEVDDRGRFRFTRLPRGPVRLRMEAAGERLFLTPWLAL